MAGPERTDHRGYGEAVIRELQALDIWVEGHLGIQQSASKRAMSISLDPLQFWDNRRFENTIRVGLEWDEEQGWTVLDTNEPGAVRGLAYTYYGLGMDLVPEPAEVARTVEALCADESFSDRSIYKRRRAEDHDPEFEAALAAHLRPADGD
ncbi:hypothetical protein GCM10029978_093820 [Actinoallomurus acanthiterrae]